MKGFFKFFECSGSQLENLCFLFTMIDPTEIINDLGNCDKIKNVWKRLGGLVFSLGAMIVMIKISKEAIERVENDKVDQKVRIFSNGLGGNLPERSWDDIKRYKTIKKEYKLLCLSNKNGWIQREWFQ